jgi:hypothetical protein
VELYFHSPNTPSWRGAQLKKHRDKFTFTVVVVVVVVNFLLPSLYSNAVASAEFVEL